MSPIGSVGVPSWRMLSHTPALTLRAASPAGLWPGLIARLPKPLLVAPMVVQWLWLALRHGSVSLPSAANPNLFTGGLVGESKIECLAQVDAEQRTWLARTTSVVANAGAPREAARALDLAGLRYPIIAKPDIGWCGFGVRRIDDAAAMAGYLASYPPGERVLLQEYLDLPGEAGLFYVRWPGAAEGRLLSLTVRRPATVVGDGHSTVGELVSRDDRLRNRASLFADLQRIAAAGERIVLSSVWSHRMGGLYRDESAAITSALERRVDAIARSLPELHVARFDIRFGGLESLRAGVGFKILEINGVGSEAIQFFDPAVPFFSAYRGVFDKQAMIFAIGACNRERGHRPCGWRTLARAHLGQQRLVARYPASN
jgi:hypothetical protein